MRSQIIPDMQAIRSFCDSNEIEEMALFGSVTRQDFSPTSDVGVLIRFSPQKRPTLFDICRIESELEDFFQGRRIDLHTIKEIHPKLQPKILAEREILYGSA